MLEQFEKSVIEMKIKTTNEENTKDGNTSYLEWTVNRLQSSIHSERTFKNIRMMPWRFMW